MMTREQAITSYEKLYAYMVGDDDAIDLDYGEFMELNQYIRTALRPVSREQVEKVWRGEWLHDLETGYEHCDKCSHTISLDDYMNRKPPLFCEMCGDAKTDEAVEMVMERMEALKDAVD